VVLGELEKEDVVGCHLAATAIVVVTYGYGFALNFVLRGEKAV
jgi:hypothetical protein